ncbi:signal peptidase I [Hazenella coriacea]|uniref:Signal peptidase I n=1 Tax=Hazenella coriacea TaxID=1179467 RepID=A0A4R3L0G4_9BACL|nr:signal peptidase I [Hazenella coriacea]TCS92836.1 signal peptidase I [Hazenella coriacea]
MELITSKKRLWIMIGIACSIVILLFWIYSFFYTFYQVDGNSMEPALKNGEVYTVHKNYSTIHRGDIVVFHSSQEKMDFIKRVIALPGETIEIRDHRVYINGTVLPEPYIAKYPEIKDIEPTKIPENSYYVLGDERLYSFDSRQLGPISQADLIGMIKPEERGVTR